MQNKFIEDSSNSFSKAVLNWYFIYGRKNLPWKEKNPYKIWVSEIMLQQTKVITVIPYFKKFIKTFPNIIKLSQASQDQILFLWSGLGFYTRARNMHKTAKYVVEKYSGNFPKNFLELISLPGIGESTANAILSFTWNKRTAILDGNIKRLLSRFYNIIAYPETKLNKEFFWNISKKLVPYKNSSEYNQGMIDIGATICTPQNPKCKICPLSIKCNAFIKNNWIFFPGKKKKNTSQKKIWFCIIKKENDILLEKRSEKGIWGGLYSFPEFNSFKELIIFFKNKKTKIYQLESIFHKFSHFNLKIIPILLEYDIQLVVSKKNKFIYYNLLKPPKIGLPTPVKYLLKNLYKIKRIFLYKKL